MEHRNSWRTTLVLFGLASLIESMGFGHLSAFTPLYLADLRVPASQVAFWTGISGSVGMILGLPLLPFWGAWAERFGQKPIIVRSAVVEALLYALTALVRTPLELTLVRMLSGFVMGNTGVMMAIQSDITPRERLGLAVAMIAAGPSLAMALGPSFGGFVAATIGLRALFWIDAILSVVSSLLLVLLLKEENRVRSAVPATALALQAIGDVARERPVRNLFVVFALVALGAAMVQPFFPIWVEHWTRLGAAGPLAALPESEVIGIVLGAAGLAMALATPLLGLLGDRAGAGRSLKISVWGSGAGILTQGLANSLTAAASGRLLQGLFQGGVTANVMALLARATTPERRASVMNLSILPQQLGWLAGPLLGTALVALMGLRGMLLVGAVITLAGAVLALLRIPGEREGRAAEAAVLQESHL